VDGVLVLGLSLLLAAVLALLGHLRSRAGR
jgi:hypothetical protein